MKKILMAASFLAAGSTGAMAQSFNVSLNSYCDTFALVQDGFAIYGTHSGCGSTYVDGGATVKISKKYLETQDTIDGAEIYSWYFTPPKHNKGAWYVYEETGSGVTEINSGTYVVTGTEAVLKGNKPAISGR
jgi:hypothetical protein